MLSIMMAMRFKTNVSNSNNFSSMFNLNGWEWINDMTYNHLLEAYELITILITPIITNSSNNS